MTSAGDRNRSPADFVLTFRRFSRRGSGNTMPELGRKYTCYSCHTKFYDLGKPIPLCPKCGSDQRDADEAPVYVAPRSRRIVEEPVEEEEITPAAEPVEGDEEEGFIAPVDDREEDVEEEEEY